MNLLQRAKLRAARLFAEKTFRIWQSLGLHVVPVDFYQPIPDTRDLSPNLWSGASEMPGLDMNEAAQLEFLRLCREKYKAECDAFPRQPTGDPFQYYEDNVYFRSGDAEILYCMVRDLKPRRLIEVGSGFTTLISAQAIRKNQEEDPAYACEFTAIEPYPNPPLNSGMPGLSRLIEKKIQDVPLEEFQKLEAGDILFIDSSHVLKIGSDVHYEFLEILPRLRPGVTIHFHDIFLPREYPEAWVRNKTRFWNEQYLLQAFMAFNGAFEVAWAGGYMRERHAEEMEKAFALFNRVERWPGSFWIKKIR